MATNSNYALRIPSSLMEDIRVAAMRDGVSMNSFIVQAVAEKTAVLRSQGALRIPGPAEQAAYLEGRAARARDGDLAEVLRRAGTTTDVLPGDEIPDGWLVGPEPAEEATGPSPGRVG
jgi:hypothetical protein